MSKGEAYKNQHLALLFNNANIANVGDATGLQGSGSAGALYVALHTSNPAGYGNDQQTAEISYTGYNRVAVPRSNAGFTVTGPVVSFTNTLAFPMMLGGAGRTVTHFSIGVAASGASMILYSGAVSPVIPVTANVFPGLSAGTTITEI